MILANRSMAQLKLKRYQAAMMDANRSLTLNPRYAKAHFRLGKALEGMGRSKEAKQAFGIADKLSKSVIHSDRKPDARDFEEESRLGDGNFSRVVKVREHTHTK